jgi:thiamine biosynthesis protein ThiS
VDTAAPPGRRPFVFVKISVNGQPMMVEGGTTVDGLLDLLKITRQFTAVAVNREVTPKSEYGTTPLREGDKVEIVRPMGGG